MFQFTAVLVLSNTVFLIISLPRDSERYYFERRA
ncbi:unnamed protein product [Leptidea sinapis]|uniref:Uncharacterized protein n=1 Tax=Leptidea sinapis TaxID=189913 RepID=A0A5E4QD36_9NEOP|nr:unnamed protein product [Leptidea sinapis]